MQKIAEFFKFQELQTNLKTEILAGIATFLTMAYIIVVNPGILSNTGMSFAGVLTATIIVCTLSSVAMGLFANLPFALAPGMGINAFFTFSLVIGMKVPWETALGAVFISGIIFLVLSLFKVREYIVAAIPKSLRYGVAAGIGIFLALIGLTSVGFITGSPATTVTFGGINTQTVIFITGLLLTAILVIRKIKGALIFGIIGTSLIALVVSLIQGRLGGAGFVTLPEKIFAPPSFEVLLKLDIPGALKWGMILPIFTLLFTDMFDSISTFVGVAEVGGFIEKDTGNPRNVGRALLVDAFATTISGLAGTSSGTTYIESAAGVEEGGRSGLTAVVAGLCFLPFLFLSPLLAFIPAVATAPILVLIGVFMLAPLKNVNWSHYEETIPLFLALILIPLTYSITQGIIWGFLSYTVIKLMCGKVREIPVALWIIDLFAILSLVIPLLGA